MNVKIYQAVLTINEKEVKLTKAIAKQFPMQYWEIRFEAMRSGSGVATPICKVRAHTLDKDYSMHAWKILVDDVDAGLAWADPVKNDLGFKGDVLSEIPTVIL